MPARHRDSLIADVLHFDKSRAVDANDVDPNHIDTTMLAAIAAEQKTDGNGGNAI